MKKTQLELENRESTLSKWCFCSYHGYSYMSFMESDLFLSCSGQHITNVKLFSVISGWQHCTIFPISWQPGSVPAISVKFLFPSPAPLSFSLCSPFQHCLSLTLLLSLSLTLSSLPLTLFWMCSSPAESLTVSSSLFSWAAFQEPGTSLGGGGRAVRGSGRGVSASPPWRSPTQLLHSIGR